MSSTVRLDKLLSNLGYGTRAEVAALARAGEVTLDASPVWDARGRIALTPDLAQRLSVMGQRLDPLPGLVIVMNKPCGVTCSRKEDGRLIYDLLPLRYLRRDPALSTVGRLDKDTSGLLLLTDDGALLHRLISPKHHVAKVYRADLARPLEGHESAALASGAMMLEGDDKPLLPARLEVLGEREARIHVHEGRYHMVRRMFAALGNHVEALHREAMGGFALPDDLEPGHWRAMTRSEIDSLFAPEGP